jgi:hypothetical protein
MHYGLLRPSLSLSRSTRCASGEALSVFASRSLGGAPERIEYLEAHDRLLFWAPRNLSHHMIRQARNVDTVLVKSTETGGTQTLTCWLG